LNEFFSLNKDLASLYEREFKLVYYTSLTSNDCSRMTIKKLDWMYGRLIKQKQDEREAANKTTKERDIAWQRRY
jgi:hypothetical protein